MLSKPKPLDPDFSRIRQKFKILIWYLFLDFGSNSKTTKKIQIGGGAKKGQKKSVPVVCSFKQDAKNLGNIRELESLILKISLKIK